MGMVKSVEYKNHSLILSTKTMHDGRFFGVVRIHQSSNNKAEGRDISSPRMFLTEGEAIEDILKRAKNFIDEGRVRYHRDL